LLVGETRYFKFGIHFSYGHSTSGKIQTASRPTAVTSTEASNLLDEM